MKYRSLAGPKFGKEVAKKLGLEGANRVIIDIRGGKPVIIYAEFRGDERLYDINLDVLPVEIKAIEEER